MTNDNKPRKRRENRPTDSFGGPNPHGNTISLSVVLIAFAFFLVLQWTGGDLGNIVQGPAAMPISAHAASILTAITDLGWYAGYIDGSLVDDKATFLRAMGQAFAFPDYYRRNLDTFEEMINDLAWVQATGYTVLYDSAYRLPPSNASCPSSPHKPPSHSGNHVLRLRRE